MQGFGELGRDILFAKDRRSKSVEKRRTIGHPIRAAGLNGRRKRIKSGPRK